MTTKIIIIIIAIYWLLVAAIFNEPMTVLWYNIHSLTWSDLPREGVFIGGWCIRIKMMLSGIKKKRSIFLYREKQKSPIFMIIVVGATLHIPLQDLLFPHWCYTQRKIMAVLWGILQSPQSLTPIPLLYSIHFLIITEDILLSCFSTLPINQTTLEVKQSSLLPLSLSPSPSGAESRVWRKGCGGVERAD